jgi:DNA-binding LytR/AlgR family response regulator
MSEYPRSEIQMEIATSAPILPVTVDIECETANTENDSINSRQVTGATDTGDMLATPAIRVGESKRSLPPHREVLNRKAARIAIQSKGRIRLLQSIDLVSVHAQGNHVLLQLQTGSHLVRGSISTMAEKLEPYGFIRIHRSVLINSTHVEDVRSLPTGEYGLRVGSGKTYRVSRRYTKNLPLLAELWLGSEPGNGRV